VIDGRTVRPSSDLVMHGAADGECVRRVPPLTAQPFAALEPDPMSAR
jgi:hypothetical protein